MATNRGIDEENLRLSEQHLFLKFRIYRNAEVDVAPSFHFESKNIDRQGNWTPYGIELRDARERVLISRRVWTLERHKNLDNAWLDFTKQIPFPKETVYIVFTCGEEGDCAQKEIHRVKVPPETPEVRITSPEETGKLEGKVKVAWQVSGSQGAQEKGSYTSLVRYSNDAGRTWRAVASRTQEFTMEVDLDQLPGGDACQFQVLVTSGIRTGMAISAPFEVPRKEVGVTIAPPEGGNVVPSGEHIVLVGEAYSPELGSASPEDLHWSSNLQGDLGSGHELNLERLQPGKHKLTLSAPGKGKARRTASIQIEIRQPKPRKHTSRTHPGHRSTDHDSGQVKTKP